MAINIKIFAIEYEMECATPRISFGNSSAVMVHGIVSNPIMEKQTYNSIQATGTQSCVEVPIVMTRTKRKNRHTKCVSKIKKSRILNVCACLSTIFNPLGECARNEHNNSHADTRCHNQWSSLETFQEPSVRQWHKESCDSNKNRYLICIHITANILLWYEISKYLW